MSLSFRLKRALPVFTCIIPIATHAAAASPNQSGAGPAIAETVAPSQLTTGDQAKDNDPQLSEVIVTARFRKENLQEVPIAAEVVSGQTMQQQNVNDLATLSQTVPSLHIDSTSGLSDPIYMRGIGTNAGQSFDQAVGVFIDDIYYGRSIFTTATLLDVDRVEVLKGPQSTFFGNNAVAGALNIVTNDPGNQFEADARAIYGQYGEEAVEAAAGGPISDTLGIRVAVMNAGQEGWLTNVNGGNSEPRDRTSAGRVTLEFKPTQNLDAILKIDASNDHNSGLPYQLIDCPRPLNPYGLTGSASINGNCGIALSEGDPLGLNNDLTGHNPQSADFTPVTYALHVNYNMSGYTFTSVSGYTEYHSNIDIDGDQLEAKLVSAQLPERYDQFSQEFRVSSPTDGTISYLAGAYFQADHLYTRESLSLFEVGPLFEGLPPGENVLFAQPEHDYSVFGSLTWNVTDRLKLTAGVRGTEVKKSFIYSRDWGAASQLYGGITPYPGGLCSETTPGSGLQAIAGAIFSAPGCAYTGARSDKDWYPSANIQYQITPREMVYFRFDQSFMAGGFNGNATTGSASTLAYRPEYVNSYELGLKSTWFDNRLRMNFDVFRMDYRDFQVFGQTQDPATGFILSSVENAAAVRSQGVETEVQWAVTDKLRLSTNVAYLDAIYLKYRNAPLTYLEQFCKSNPNSDCMALFPSGIGTSMNMSGWQLDLAPKWSGNVMGTYSQPLPGGYAMTGELDGYISSAWYRNLLDQMVGGYAVVNGTLGLQTPSRRWSFNLMVKNLANRVYPIGDPSRGSPYAIKGQPRTFLGEVLYQY